MKARYLVVGLHGDGSSLAVEHPLEDAKWDTEDFNEALIARDAMRASNSTYANFHIFAISAEPDGSE